MKKIGIKLPGDDNYPPPDKRDLTDWLARALTDTASSNDIELIQYCISGAGSQTGCNYWAIAAYINLVRPGGKYDVKLLIKQNLGDTIKIGNKWYEYSVAGNILFGYYSHAAGFELRDLQKGAGVVQIFDYVRKGCPNSPNCDTTLGTKNTFYDSPDDFSSIQFGYELFDGTSAQDGVITADELTVALDSYVGPYPLDVRHDPGNYIPGGYYSTDAFYH